MADEDEKEEYSNQARFGWNYAGEVFLEDDDGNLVRGGDVPPEIQEILDRHAEKVKQQNSAKAKDARPRQSKVKLHIHRK